VIFISDKMVDENDDDVPLLNDDDDEQLITTDDRQPIVEAVFVVTFDIKYGRINYLLFIFFYNFFLKR